MEKNPKFNKRRAFDKDVGPGKESKINKHRAYVYSGVHRKCHQLRHVSHSVFAKSYKEQYFNLTCVFT